MTLPFFAIHGCRSGSTLLSALLAQNPSNHCTATNDLALMLANAQNLWTTLDGFKSQGIDSLVPRIRNLLYGMIRGFYATEFETGKAIFDKSRDWLCRIELIEEILAQPVRVIVPVRDIRDVVASLEKLFRENQISRPSRTIEQQLGSQTILDRCKKYLAADAMLGMWINSLKDCHEKGLSDRLLIVPYHCLVNDPIGTVSQIHRDLGLLDFICEDTGIRNAANEDDQVHGRPFHALRTDVDTSAVGRWRDYLTTEVAEWVDAEYPSIQGLVRRGYHCGWVDQSGVFIPSEHQSERLEHHAENTLAHCA